jgi:hypothetical protein
MAQKDFQEIIDNAINFNLNFFGLIFTFLILIFGNFLYNFFITIPNFSNMFINKLSFIILTIIGIWISQLIFWGIHYLYFGKPFFGDGDN